MKEWYQKNREILLDKMKEYCKRWYTTIEGYNYRGWYGNIRADIEANRINKKLPNSYITEQQRLEMIKQPCFYCEEEKPFNEMGVDRIDNDLPHTIDNCVPCCTECNIKRGNRYTHEEFKEIMMSKL